MTSRPIVAVTRAIPEAGLAILREHSELRLWDNDLPPNAEELDKLLDGADGALTLLTEKVDGALLDRHPSIKSISNLAVGFDNIDVPAATERGVAVSNTPGVLTQATAEFAFTLLVSAARRVVEAATYVRDGRWVTWGPKLLLGQDIANATLGIVGFGRIGKELARMASGFNMRLLAHDAYEDPKAPEEFGVTYVGLDQLLQESDFVSLHVALTPETRHMISTRELGLMKTSAVLVNASRGPVVDTDALVQALQDNEIFAAGLDVTDPEPLPATHPLVNLPNAIVVPHIASATYSTRDDMATLAARNVLDVLNGRTPEVIINPEVLS